MRKRRIIAAIVVVAMLLTNVVLPQRQAKAFTQQEKDSAVYTNLAKGKLKVKALKETEINLVAKITVRNRQKAKYVGWELKKVRVLNKKVKIVSIKKKELVVLIRGRTIGKSKVKLYFWNTNWRKWRAAGIKAARQKAVTIKIDVVKSKSQMIISLPQATLKPSATQTSAPTKTPTKEPTQTSVPTKTPTKEPTQTSAPTKEPTQTSVPTKTPTKEPTQTSAPTKTPTKEPTQTSAPTKTPTKEPTQTSAPTKEPTQTSAPTKEPTQTSTPTPDVTNAPTIEPTKLPPGEPDEPDEQEPGEPEDPPEEEPTSNIEMFAMFESKKR